MNLHNVTENQRALAALGAFWAPGEDEDAENLVEQLGIDLDTRTESQGGALVGLVLAAGLVLPEPWGPALADIPRLISLDDGRIYLRGRRQQGFEDARASSAILAGVRYPEGDELVDYLEGFEEHLTVRDWYAAPFTWAWCCAFRQARQQGQERDEAEQTADRRVLAAHGLLDAAPAGDPQSPLALVNASVRAALLEGPPVPLTMRACYLSVVDQDPLHLRGG